MPFIPLFASFSKSFLLKSSSLGSRLLFSLAFAQPVFSNSVVRSMPPISACPKSRGVSSLEGKVCVGVNVISLPTAKARKYSRLSNAQGYQQL